MKNDRFPVRWDLHGKPYEAYYAVQTEEKPVHWHAHFLLTLVETGSGVQVLNGVTHKQTPGTVVVMSPWDFHFNRATDDPVGYYAVKFPYEAVCGRLDIFGGLDSYPLVGTLSGEPLETAVMLFRLLLREQENREPASDLFAQTIIEQLMILALRHCRSKNASAAGSKAIRKALVYIHEHFREQITAERVAEIADYSPGHFSRCFREGTGVPFQTYLRDLRLDFARNLLTTSALSVTECAAEAGFLSASNFCRVFKQKFGCTPETFIRGDNMDDLSESDTGLQSSPAFKA